MSEYDDLYETGFSGVDTKTPEEEFFHSIYISGQSRLNHINVREEQGLFQVRGVTYNKPEIHMIITHIKEVLSKTIRDGQKDILKCFSYKSGDPWKGTTGRVCGRNSAERAANDFCKECKSQIIVAGLLCNPDGSPIMGADGKAAFGFIRAKGMKYGPVSEYLMSLYKMELPHLIKTGDDEESKKFEKSVINHKRFITVISKGYASSQFGDKAVFNLTIGKQLPDEQVKSILRISREVLPKFNEKFDWSKKAKPSSSTPTDFVPFDQPADGQSATPQAQPALEPQQQKAPEPAVDSFSFDDIKF